jgi:hypothetical protein
MRSLAYFAGTKVMEASRILGAMTNYSLRRLMRNAEAPRLLESFLIAAVTSFLAIRGFLALTDYPKIGSGEIHIAHMLWGGLLMLLALMLLLGFLDRSVEYVAAVTAGLGFGTFIDEIGKFITADNNYFYRPAIALIYGVFVGVFLVARTLIGSRPLSPAEAIANALNLLARLPEGPIDPDDRARLRFLLDRADQDATLSQLARDYVADLPTADDDDGPVARAKRRLARGYTDVMAKPWVERALTLLVIAYAAAAVAGVILRATSTLSGAPGEPSTVATVAQVSSTILGAALVGVGVVRLQSSREAAYQWFMRGLLVWILLTQMFVFYSSQLAGLGGLFVDLVAYGSLRFALEREVGASEDREGADLRVG